MGTVVTLMGALILGLLGLAFLLLSIPWVVSVVATAGPARRLDVELRPFASGFPLSIRVDRSEYGAIRDENACVDEKASGEPDHEETTAHNRESRGRRHIVRMLRAAPRLVRGLVSAVSIERLRVTGRVGLADPADTGQLFGALFPLASMLHSPRCAIDLQPDFAGPSLEGEIEAGIRVYPIRIVPATLRFGWQVFVRRE